MVIDFKEIPQANVANGQQDTFELFARDFLAMLGFTILSNPDRGADGAKDMIVEETMKGVLGEERRKYLVSCKHYAHTGQSVGVGDEQSITDRIQQHGCKGFIGIYSTILSSRLNDRLKQIGLPFMAFDHERIESELLKRDEGFVILKRYFPSSFKKWCQENTAPAKIFNERPTLECDCCHRNLLDGEDNGIYVLLYEDNFTGSDIPEVRFNADMYFACKGNCDKKLKEHFRQKGLMDNGWEDISDLKNPSLWIKRLMAFANGSFQDHDLSEVAFKKVKQMFLNTYPYVARNMTKEEEERLRHLLQYGIE